MCHARGLGSRSVYLVKYKSNNGPELSTRHRHKQSQCCDQEVRACGAESERQAICSPFNPIDPKALVNVGGRVQGLRHLVSLRCQERSSLPSPVIQFFYCMSMGEAGMTS